MRKLIKFSLVGGINTFADFCIFSFLTALLGMLPVSANAISYSIGIVISFTINCTWTFRNDVYNPASQFMRFLLISLAALFLSTTLIGMLSEFLPPVASKVASLPLMLLWNFAMTRRFVFDPAH